MQFDLIFCDDIRTEVGGQHTLVGVYQFGVVAPTLPVMGRFFCWLRIRGLSLGPHKLDFYLSASAPDGSPVGTDGEVSIVDDSAPLVIPLGPYLVSLEEQGDMYATLKIDDGDPTIVGSLNVTLGKVEGQNPQTS